MVAGPPWVGELLSGDSIPWHRVFKPQLTYKPLIVLVFRRS